MADLLFRRKVDKLNITVDHFKDWPTDSNRVEPGNHSHATVKIIHLDNQGLFNLMNL